jgi:hypothetical protein
MKLLTSLHLIF